MWLAPLLELVGLAVAEVAEDNQQGVVGGRVKTVRVKTTNRE